eukprot:Em0003g995a
MSAIAGHGLRDVRVQRRLFAEPKLTFTKAFELAQAAELAEKSSQDISRAGASVNALGPRRATAGQTVDHPTPCFRCGVVGCSGSPQFVGKALFQLTRIGFAAIISYQVILVSIHCILTSFQAFLMMWMVEHCKQMHAIAAQRISLVDDISHHVEPSVTDMQVQAHFEVNPVTVNESSQNDKCIQVMPSVSDNAVQVELLMDDNTFGGKPLTKAVMVQADVEYPAMIHGSVQTEETDQCYSCVNLRVNKLKLQACIGPLSEQHLKDDDKKVNFYTGLPTFSMLDFIVKFVSSGIPFIGKLSRFQEILLVLMKLRLNLEEQDLAYRFCVSQSTVSNVFRKWIYIMAEQLSFLIHWPSREQMMTSMPMVFRKFFKNCICILDCTEVFIERPANLQARSHTWSEYKHHNTIKVLIAVTPQGTISFISEAWGGRASDIFITEHSGVLDKLEHGDLVLADRGFTIEDSVGLYCATLCRPPFTKGKKQLSRNEVDYA